MTQVVLMIQIIWITWKVKMKKQIYKFITNSILFTVLLAILIIPIGTLGFMKTEKADVLGQQSYREKTRMLERELSPETTSSYNPESER